MMRPILGGPGVSDEALFSRKHVFRDGKFDPLPGGGWINATKSRNPFATEIQVLEAGLLMGQVTTTRLWATAFFGVTQAAITGAATSLTLTAAQATELVRRIGSTGTFTLTGPPAASGVSRQVTVTYSAVNVTTGVVTITAVNVNEVQRINFNIAATGGSVQLKVPHVAGDMITTTTAAWSATDATFLSNINTVLDVATGVTGGIVASAISAVDTDLGFLLTYSGTGYAGVAQPMAEVTLLPTSSTTWNSIRTVAGVPGAFAAGSLVGDTDGSAIPLSCIPPGYGIMVADGANQPTREAWAAIPISGIITMEQLQPVITDTGIRTWVKEKMSTLSGGKFIFADTYAAAGA